MKLVMKVLGEVDEKDISFLSEKPAIQYITDIAKGCVKQPFDKRLPSTNKDYVDMMKWALELNPFFRCSASELLK